jgi:Secretion system C-terminal sorting domain
MPLTITNTTICNNYIYGYGGGINSLASSTTTITNCTIVNNTSEQDGGGISIGGNTGCALQIKNTIIANNTSNTVPASADVDMFSGTLIDNGYNIVEVGTGTFTATGDKTGNQANLFGNGISATPSLALNNSVNGTPTLKTTSGSIAINAGNSSANGSVSVPTTDQRGATRNGTTDIGAYEYWSDAGALPVELSSFTAIANNSSTTLSWKTATEVNNYGFEVERRTVGETVNGKWEKVGFVAGNGTSNTAHTYAYADANISSGTYAYRLKQIDNDGTYKYSSETEVTISIPKVLSLANYPNPFNPSTMISYQVPNSSHVNLRVFDVLGREVATLVNEVKSAGAYKAMFNASNFSSGVYFYQLNAGSFIQTKKMLLMK